MCREAAEERNRYLEQKLVGQAGQEFTTHCLRDTFATLKILRGKHPGWVALMLEHETEQTTRERYYQWIRMVEENPLCAVK